jgi:2-polyprenyl-3-methyl-5-hydroxy-6-metoxy-1,4-benzoquinol methylase
MVWVRMTLEKRNFDFYDEHYRALHPLTFLLHGALSFDQRSKTRPNLALLEPVLRERRSSEPAAPLRVLDYGSGFGTLLLSLPRHGLELYAYDLSERAVLQLCAAGRYLGREIRPFDPRKLPREQALLDVIVCSHVLEHVPSDTDLIVQLVAALAPCGLLLVNVPIHEQWDDPKHARRYDDRKLCELLADHGLSVLTTLETDRWSAWLSRHEQRQGQTKAVKAALRVVRLMLGQMPWALLAHLEQRFLGQLPPQQLLVLAEKR